MPRFTYLPGEGDPETTSTHGFSFTAGEWTPIPDDHPAVEKLRANRFFAEEPGSSIPLSELRTMDAEQHESGNGAVQPSETTGNEQYARTREGTPVDISPQQCKAARAVLDWSREQLAEAAGIAERTLTDFERQASNMLRKNKVALRKAFEAAGVAFDGNNGIWLPATPAASESNGETVAEAQEAESGTVCDTAEAERDQLAA